MQITITLRQAKSGSEVWALMALRVLAGLDPDRAKVRNGEGFNKHHSEEGHSLARRGVEGLSESEWRRVLSIADRYPRQVGERPTAREASAIWGWYGLLLLQTPDRAEALKQCWADMPQILAAAAA